MIYLIYQRKGRNKEMTRKEAIEHNKNLRMYMKLFDKNNPCKFNEENYIALDMAIKALEQEPCEKYIEEIDHLRRYISKLETQIAEQEHQAGHWKHNKCDMCGASRPPLFDNYCPHCGAYMKNENNDE